MTGSEKQGLTSKALWVLEEVNHTLILLQCGKEPGWDLQSNGDSKLGSIKEMLWACASQNAGRFITFL